MTNNNELLAHTLDIAARYGVREDSPLALAPYTHSELSDEYWYDVPLSDSDLVRIDRLRLLGDSDGWAYPYLDVSYCYGTMRDGAHVRVDLGSATAGSLESFSISWRGSLTTLELGGRMRGYDKQRSSSIVYLRK